MITIHAWLLYVLLVVAVLLGLMCAGLFRANRITELEDQLAAANAEKKRLAVDLAKAIGHPSVRQQLKQFSRLN